MAADQGIQIAGDGVAEVSMTGARANLTRLIRLAREDGRPGAFTDRGERRAYVVTPEVYEQAQYGRLVEQALNAMPSDEREQIKAHLLRYWP
jgi:PHD/YefM family antitoxin component YafN of YafNO toxin-antitoxin module